MRLDPPFTPTVSGTDASGMPQLARGPLAYTRPAPAFTRAMVAVAQQSNNATSNLSGALAPEGQTTLWNVAVQPGQTLTGIVREQMAARGVNVTNSEALRLAQTVAQSNKIQNANLIHPGQRLNLDSLSTVVTQAQTIQNAVAQSVMSSNATAASNFASAAQPGVASALAGTAQVQLLTRVDRGNNPVLEKTIDRAIEKGFIPAQDKQAVMNKILQLSQQHRFSPDDFARLSLMESDGLNPKATNNRCHGIIQFCDGPDRGAASAGFGANPKAILGHSVLQQLDMVGKYFEDTGLKNYGPVGLDDLYLTVLTPAARNETRPNVALNIPGQQAAYLHVNRDTRAPITRNSILAGLHQNANERLGVDVAQRQQTLQAARLSAYAAQASVTRVE